MFALHFQKTKYAIGWVFELKSKLTTVEPHLLPTKGLCQSTVHHVHINDHKKAGFKPRLASGGYFLLESVQKAWK